jgi:lipopolysaccharide transport system ATP-binding protein
MGNIAVKLDGISKKYLIAAQKTKHDTLRDHLTESIRSILKRNGKDRTNAITDSSFTNEFWALEDVSFEVKFGEVLGIIGRNGAGKSTLLKILSRITEPTSGRGNIYGRVGSLLEVGTGFHPELSGRENIYLNGAILGMSRSEIAGKFDEIVAFSEVDKFLETPVKRYSSGMYVRLAFAVAAHLQPEILIVDEVLAVGDAAFQKKCLGKMGEVAKDGRTVIFVSHNLDAVEHLCHKGVVIQQGRIGFIGSQSDAIGFFLRDISQNTAHAEFSFSDRTNNKFNSRILEARVTSNGEYSDTGYKVTAPLEFHVRCETNVALRLPALGIGLDNSIGQRVVTLHSKFTAGGEMLGPIGTGNFGFKCRIERLPLAPGEYRVKLSLENNEIPLHVIDDALMFRILPTDYYNNGGMHGRGVILCKQNWKIDCE